MAMGLLRFAAILLLLCGGGYLLDQFNRPHDPDLARAGDCMSGHSASVQRVECTDAKVKWRIEGIIKNVSQRQFHDRQSDVCARYPKSTAAFFKQTGWGDSSERIGYVLCLRKTQPLPTKKP
jgi:hypothetical protein